MLKFLILPILVATVALGLDVVKADTVAIHGCHRPLQ
jgi:hypothetical protein